MGTNEAPVIVTPDMVYDIVREASLVHFEAYCPGTAHKMADRLAAGVSSGYRRATLTQRDDWTKLGADSLRAAAVMIATYGLNPDPGARELYIFPRGGQLVVSPTPEGVRTMLANAGYMIDVYLCGPHDADGIDVRAGRVSAFNPGRAPLDWVATPATCIGARVCVIDRETGEAVVDRWLPTAIIERRRKSGGDGKPWRETWDEMAVKTGQHFALKYMPKDRLSLAVIEAASADWDASVASEPAEPARRAVASFNVPTQIPARAPAPESRQIAAPTDIEHSQVRQPDPVPTQQQTAPPAQAAAPADPVKVLRAQRAALIAEIADLSGISGDTVARARAVMRAAGCAEVASPSENDLATQINLLTSHLEEARVAALERDGAAESR